MDIIGYEDLFNFSNSASLDDAIKNIEQLEKVYASMVKSVSGQTRSLATELDNVKLDAAALLKAIEALNASAAKNASIYNDVAKSTDALASSQAELKAKEDASNKAMEKMLANAAALKKAKDDLKNSNASESGSIDSLKKQLDEATKAYKKMGEATDSSIKKDQLDKIDDLNNKYKTATSTLKTAKTAVDAAAGSYNELSAKVNENRKTLRAMEGGIGSTSNEFKKLQKQIKEDDHTLKVWDDSIGQNQRSVGDYKGQLSALIPGFSQVSGAIDTASAASKAFLANPIGLVIGAIALAVGSLVAYFKGSVEGQDRWNKIMAYGSTILDLLLDGLESLGAYIISIPNKLKPLGDALVKIWENPLDALKSFGNLIKENIINRFIALGELAMSVGKIVSSGFTDGFKDFANASIKAVTGIDKVVDKVLEAGQKLTGAALLAAQQIKKEADRRLAIEQKLADKISLIRKERIKDVVDDASTELKINRLLEDSKDKFAFQDEDRLKKVREARKLLNNQVQGDINLAQLEVDAQRLRIEAAGGVLQSGKLLSELTNDEIKGIGVKYELIEELAKLEAAQINISADAANKRKAFLKQEIALIQEISAEYFDKIKREKQAQTEIDTFVAQSIIKRNNIILANENSSLDERLAAIESNNKQGLELINIAANKEYDAIKEASLAKVELNSETLATIYTDTTLSLEQQIQAEKDAKEKALMTDSAYLQERGIYLKNQEKITAQYYDSVEKLNADSTQAAEDNMFKVLSRDFNRLSNQVSTFQSQDLKAINDKFNETGDLEAYEKEKQLIIANSHERILADTLQYYKDQAALLKASGENTTAIEKQIADAELAISQATTDQKIAVVQYGIEQQAQLKQVAHDATIAIVNNELAADQQRYAVELKDLQSRKDLELTLAGDNAVAKNQIANDFLIQEDAIRRKQNETARKQAIFNKAASVFDIGVNTSKAISKALAISPETGGLPFSAIAAAIGAIQIAAVLSKPIPQFEKGVKSSPEGLALVGEAGRELGIDPSGNVTMYDKPQVTYLKKGTEIIPNSKVEALIQQAKEYGDGYMFNSNNNAIDKSSELLRVATSSHDAKLAKVFSRAMESLEGVVRKNKGQKFPIRDMKEAFADALNSNSFDQTPYK